MARRARCHRVHSATVNRPTGVSSDPILCLRLRSRWVTLARSTAGSRVGHYNYFRSYSAERGRYTQADPIGLEGGLNRFGYVEGDALAMTDPTGLYGVGGVIAGMGLNGAGQAGALMYLGGLDWESASRCVDLNKVLISGLLGMVGHTFGDVIGGKASLRSAISMQVIGQMIKKTLPFKPFTHFGCECDAARDRIKKEWPKLFHLIENVGA